MRILHTGDWHLGSRFHDHERGDEEDFALLQIRQLCKEHVVDALLIAGDIFDTANPGAAEQQRFYQFLHQLNAEDGIPNIVVIAGNHDSALRLQAPQSLLRSSGIHLMVNSPAKRQPSKLLSPYTIG